MKKAFFIALYLFVFQVAYSQSDTTKSVLEGLSTETDTTNMMKDYMEQLSDVDLLKQAILIRRFGQNQRLTDTITGFTKNTGLNVYVKSYLKQSKLWTAMAQAINYYDSIQPPYIMYDVKLIKLDAQTYSVIIEGFTDGTTLKPDMPVLKYQQFKVPATNTEKIVVDSLIAKLKTIEQSEYDIYGQFVNFYKAPDQTYGFDRYNNKFPNMLTYYQQFSQGGSPFQPWKSVELNMTDKVQAFVDSAGLGVTFKTSISSTVTSTKTPDDTLKIQFSSVGATAGQPFEIQSFYTNEKGEEQPAGLMKAIAYEKKEMNVHIINVNDNKLESFGSTVQLQNELNRIYNPAIVNFNVSATVESIEASYTTDGKEGFYANPPDEICYTLDMLEVMNVYQEKEILTLSKIHIFLVDGAGQNNNQKAIKGYAPFGKYMVFIFVDAHDDLKDLAHTIAHEIGHAAFILEHPAPLISEGSSQNLMDYGGGDELWLMQWDVLHDGNLGGIWGSGKNYGGNEANLVTKGEPSIWFSRFIQDVRYNYAFGKNIKYTAKKGGRHYKALLPGFKNSYFDEHHSILYIGTDQGDLNNGNLTLLTKEEYKWESNNPFNNSLTFTGDKDVRVFYIKDEIKGINPSEFEAAFHKYLFPDKDTWIKDFAAVITEPDRTKFAWHMAGFSEAFYNSLDLKDATTVLNSLIIHNYTDNVFQDEVLENDDISPFSEYLCGITRMLIKKHFGAQLDDCKDIEDYKSLDDLLGRHSGTSDYDEIVDKVFGDLKDGEETEIVAQGANYTNSSGKFLKQVSGCTCLCSSRKYAGRKTNPPNINYVFNKVYYKPKSENFSLLDNGMEIEKKILAGPFNGHNGDWDEMYEVVRFEKSRLKEAILEINDLLEDGTPIIIGVSYGAKKCPYNETGLTTDHYMVVVAKGRDESGRLYFRYLDPATTNGNEDDRRLIISPNLVISGECKGYRSGDSYYLVELLLDDKLTSCNQLPELGPIIKQKRADFLANKGCK